jgi:hypothetical protein
LNLNFVLEIEDALSGDSEKPFHFPNHLLSPKREDVPLLNLPSISGPCKFEYDTQELQPKCSNNEGISETLYFCSLKCIGYYFIGQKQDKET